MKGKMIWVLAFLAGVLAGCGERKDGVPPITGPAVEESAASRPRHEDPASLAREAWEAVMATNVEKVVSLSIDAGLDLSGGKMSDRMRASRYRTFLAEAREAFGGAALTAVETVELRSSRARVALTLTPADGAPDRVDLLFEKTAGGHWRLDLFAEKEF